MSDTSKATQAAEIIFPWLSDHYRGEFNRQGSYGKGETRLAEILDNLMGNPERDRLARELAEKIDAQWRLAEKKHDLKLAIMDFDMRERAHQLLKLYEEAK